MISKPLMYSLTFPLKKKKKITQGIQILLVKLVEILFLTLAIYHYPFSMSTRNFRKKQTISSCCRNNNLDLTSSSHGPWCTGSWLRGAFVLSGLNLYPLNTQFSEILPSLTLSQSYMSHLPLYDQKILKKRGNKWHPPTLTSTLQLPFKSIIRGKLMAKC